MISIELTTAEMMQAIIVGVMRQVRNIAGGHTHLYGGKEDSGWQYHIEGAMGEFAVAKHLGEFWSIGTKGGADVGEHQVRTTAGHGNRLLIHPQDPDDERFYLVTGVNGKYRIQGWILGKDGKRDEFWNDPTGGRPCYFVPQEKLQ